MEVEEEQPIFELKEDEFPYDYIYEMNGQAQISSVTLIKVLAFLLEEISRTQSMQTNFKLQIFDSKQCPAISIRDYLQRIYRLFNCSQECLILSIIYIDRLTQYHNDLVLTPLNVHRLILTSFIIGAKFFDDEYFGNIYYSQVGGLQIQEVNLLEKNFLKLINYNLFVNTQEFFQYRQKLLIQSQYIMQED